MKIWLKKKLALNAVRLPKFELVIVVGKIVVGKIQFLEREIVVAKKDEGKRFTATFRAGVILRMRRELRGL